MGNPKDIITHQEARLSVLEEVSLDKFGLEVSGVFKGEGKRGKYACHTHKSTKRGSMQVIGLYLDIWSLAFLYLL